MTAPDVMTPPISRSSSAAATVTISLDRQLNADHLTLVAAGEWGLFAERNLVVTLPSPGAPTDGISALVDGVCDLALIEATRLVDTAGADLEALGCILRRKVGVLMREERLSALRDGDLLRIAAPGSETLVDHACRRILQSWAAKQGLAVARDTISTEWVGYPMAEALLAGYDGAWVVLGSAEETEARQAGGSVRLITAEQSGLADISGLELVSRRQRSQEEQARHGAVLTAIEEASARLKADPELAVALWKRHGRGGGAEEAVRLAVAGLCAPIDRAAGRWQTLRSLA